MTLVSLALVALATARVTRLVTVDVVMQPVRKRIVDRMGVDSKLSYLIVCDWCVSMYIGTIIALLTAFGPPDVEWVWVALSSSYVAGWLNNKADD